VAAAALKAGDLLRTADNRWVPVVETLRSGDVEPVFNLCVNDWHTYFAGDVLVHNQSPAANATNPGKTHFLSRSS
jgi:hypothetical protein